MTMLYRRLGTSGLKISALSFGAWVGALAVVDQLTPEVMQRIDALTVPLAD